MSATAGWASVLQTHLPAILVLVSLPLLTAGMIQSLPLLVCLGIFPGIVAVYFFLAGYTIGEIRVLTRFVLPASMKFSPGSQE